MPNPLADFLKPRPRRHVTLVGVLTDLRNRVGVTATNVAAVLSDTAHILRHLHELKELVVTSFDQFNQTADSLAAGLEALKQRVAEDFDHVKAQLAAAGVPQETIDAATAKMQATVDAMAQVDPDPSFPAAVPPVEEPAGGEPPSEEPQPV